MTAERLLRFEVPTREALDRLVAAELPGLADQPVEVTFFREVYFDTVHRDLERRGVTARLLVRPDGARTLTVDVRERENGSDDRLIVRSHAEATVPDVGAQAVFAGASEPARLLQAITDPERLSVQLELETTRWVRRALLEGDAGVELELALDAVTVRRGDLATEFQELEIRLPEREIPALERLTRELVDHFGLRLTLASRHARAREALEGLEVDALERGIRASREVAVVARHEDRVALRRTPGGQLRIPATNGAGQEACRQLLRSLFGRGQGQVRLLGTSVGVGTQPTLEVWLAEGVQPIEDGEASGELAWLPVEELLHLVGTPIVRERRTLAALDAVARLPSETGLRPTGGRGRGEHPFVIAGTDQGSPRAGEVEAGEPSPSAPPLPSSALFNMELSELAFQERVLALAEDPRTPLLERARFISILGSNLDGFFMTRVAGYHQQVASGSRKRTQDGLTPDQQLHLIGIRASDLFRRIYTYLWEGLVPALASEGIHLLSWNDLDPADHEYLERNYFPQLAAVLTPLVADPSHPFPHIRNLRPALALLVRVPDSRAEHFAAIELPGDMPRFVPLPGGRRFIALEEVVGASLPTLYSGLEVVTAHMFRVTRSGNLSIDEEAIGDLLLAVEEQVQKRPLGPVVRLEVVDSMPQEMRDLLLRELQFEASQRVSTLRGQDVYAVDRLVDLFGLKEIADLPLPELHYPPLHRRSPVDPHRPMWPQLREREILVQFPHDSFEATVERLLAEAASDDAVVSIKITLYRTSRSSRVVKLLRRARRKGKEVVAMVELKASFDESRNIEWARALESAGIHVVYGPAHLKVHAKVMLIVRREEEALRRYLYIGTGNLNAATAASYTDLALLSADPVLGEELSDVFHGLTGYSVRSDFQNLLVAPFNMRERFLELIGREADNAEAGKEAHIRVKLNGLTDPEIVAALYRASQAGVRVELVIRGLCVLRPGVPGVSENIRVVSILGRFLEHSRIFRFANGGSPEYFIGSADWRPRNLSKRVEVVTPVANADHRAELDRILDTCLADPEAWELQPDGTYRRQAGVER